MLPGSLVSVYQQYKADTDFVASWLASTAKVCGYPADLLSKSSPPPPSKSGRAKGKARKRAPKGATAAKAASSKCVIALADFLPLANFISKSTKPPVQVPDVFSATINRLIEVRNGFGDRMEEHGTKPGPAKNENHLLFVGVLEAVRDALRPRMSSSAAEAAAAASASVPAPESKPSNRFEFLDVYEPSQTLLDAPPVEQPQPGRKDMMVYESEPQTSPKDVIFAFVLLMDDLNKIRAQIQRIWSHHRDGSCGLAAAAVATNTAVEFGHGLIDELVPLLNNYDGGSWALTAQYNALLCVQRGFDPERAVEEVSAGRPDNRTYEIATESCLITHYIMNSLPGVITPESIPLHKDGTFGVYDPSSDRNGKTGQQKFEEDRIVIMETFTDIMTVVRSVPDYPVADELMRAIKEMDKTLEVPFYGVFAAQVLLDIHHTLRGSLRKSFDAMTTQNGVMARSLGQHLEFHKNFRIANWPVEKDKWIADTQKVINWIGSDPICKAKVTANSGNTGFGIEPSSKHRLLIYSPVISGLILFPPPRHGARDQHRSGQRLGIDCVPGSSVQRPAEGRHADITVAGHGTLP